MAGRVLLDRKKELFPDMGKTLPESIMGEEVRRTAETMTIEQKRKKEQITQALKPIFYGFLLAAKKSGVEMA